MTGYHEKFLKMLDDEINDWEESVSNKARYEDGILYGLEIAKRLFQESNK